MGSKTGGMYTKVHSNGRVGGVWVEGRDGDEKMGEAAARRLIMSAGLAVWQRPQWPLWQQPVVLSASLAGRVPQDSPRQRSKIQEKGGFWGSGLPGA